MAEQPRTVTLSVSSDESFAARLSRAFEGVPQGEHISFATPELLWRLLTPKRWDILRHMAGEGPLSMREVARRVGRDVKAVHGDLTELVEAGIVERTGAGVLFPYDSVHVDFVLKAA